MKRSFSAIIALFILCLLIQADVVAGRIDPVVALASAAAKAEQEKEETVYITKTGRKYHRDGCRHLSKSKVAIKRKDVIARGYEPCSVCKP